MAKRHNIGLVVGVIVPVKGQLRPRHKGNRIEIADIGLADLIEALFVAVRVFLLIDQELKVIQNSQCDQAQGGQPLLAIDHVEDFVVLGLKDEIPHVMSRLASGPYGPKNIHPEIFPLFLTPTVIALKARDPVGKPIAHQLSVGVILGVEVSR
jgi:hypothetical protein